MNKNQTTNKYLQSKKRQIIIYIYILWNTSTDESQKF